jgi:hypothetical protein
MRHIFMSEKYYKKNITKKKYYKKKYYKKKYYIFSDKYGNNFNIRGYINSFQSTEIRSLRKY